MFSQCFVGFLLPQNWIIALKNEVWRWYVECDYLNITCDSWCDALHAVITSHYFYFLYFFIFIYLFILFFLKFKHLPANCDMQILDFQLYLHVTSKSFNFHLAYNLNGLIVTFTLYFDVENVQKSLWKHYDENHSVTYCNCSCNAEWI